MRKLVLMLILVSIGFVYAQSENHYEGYNDELTSSPTTEEIINTEPINISIVSGTVDSDTPDTTPEMDMTASMDAYYTEKIQKISVPLWYRWRNYSFNAVIPYVIERKMIDTWTDDEFTASGLGDISIGVSYGRYMEEWDIFFDGNLTVKLPTGDETGGEITDSGGWESFHPVPMGTGSMDFIGALSIYKFYETFTLKSKILYKYGGEYDYSVEYNDGLNLFERNGKYGDQFIFDAGISYPWLYRLTFGLDLNYGMNSAGEEYIYDDDFFDEMAFADLRPSVKYDISILEFSIGAKIPIYTDIKSLSNSDETRNFGFYFRTNYKLF